MLTSVDALFLSFVFAFGAVIGSFLNVVIRRYEKEEELTGRSYCPHCKKQLTWYELVPIVSYLLQKRKCRGCGASVSPQYPLVELATALLFVLVVHTVVGNSVEGLVHISLVTLLELVLHLGIWALLVVITVYDLRTKLIPDKFSYAFSALALILLFVPSIVTLTLPAYSALLAGPLYFLPFYLLWKVSSGRWIGLGDGKLALGIGWYLGLVLSGSALLLAFWIGAGVSVLLIGFQRLLKRATGGEALTLKSEIPFGPFLVLGMFLVYFFGIDVFTLLLV